MAQGQEIRVGILVFAGIVILILFSFMIGDFHLFEKGYFLRVSYNFVAGLEQGSPVRIAGVKAGEVKKITFVPARNVVELTLWIKKDVKISRDAKFYINTLGLMGEKYVEISPGISAEFIDTHQIIKGEDPIRFEKVMESIGAALEEAQMALRSAGMVAAQISEKMGVQFDQMISDVGQFVHGLNVIVASSRERIEVSLDNVQEISTTLRKDVTEILGSVKTITADIEDITTEKKEDLKIAISGLKDLSVNLEKTFALVNAVLEKVEKGKGTVGALLVDPEIETEMREIITNLKEFTADVKKHPWKLLVK